jgi:hypothetical protein
MNFYFVRTKFDQDIYGKETIENIEYNSDQEQELYNKVKKEILTRLQNEDLKPKNVYILSALISKIRSIDNRQRFDFELFLEEIIKNLNDEKKMPLAIALDAFAGIKITNIRQKFIEDLIMNSVLYW